MKVICIKPGTQNKWRHGINGEIFEGPEYGNIYTAIATHETIYGQAYSLAEFSSGKFLASAFAPLSEIDETELSKEIVKELVNE
jgi:2-keto-3-deoxy-galactonokinase